MQKLDHEQWRDLQKIPRESHVTVTLRSVPGSACTYLIGDNSQHKEIVPKHTHEVIFAGDDDRRYVLALPVLVYFFHEEVTHITARKSSPVLLDDDFAVET